MTGNDTKKIGLLSSIYCTVFFNKELSGLAFSTYQLLLSGGFFCSFLLQPSLWNKEYHITPFESGDQHDLQLSWC